MIESMATDPLSIPERSLSSFDWPSLHARTRLHFQEHECVQDMVFFDTADQVISALKELYQRQVTQARQTIFSDQRSAGARHYPYLGIYVPVCDSTLLQSYGLFSHPGFYGTTITQPVLYEGYLHQQITLLMQSHEILVGVGKSPRHIPVAFLPSIPLEVMSSAEIVAKTPVQGTGPNATSMRVHLPSLYGLQDCEDEAKDWDALPTKPLGLFSAPRIDYSLARLQHYCGTSADQFQNFILLTNYSHYVDSFLAYAQEQERLKQGYVSWSGPMGRWHRLDQGIPEEYVDEGRAFQMPAYHLQKADRQGITLINIGVGPSNMKTITDHLSVLRSHCWIMLGHCGGLHHTQRLGDFVIANAYMREDRVLDEELPLNIPIPPVSDVQQALHQAGTRFFPDPDQLYRSLRSGTVLTTANRNWELRTTSFSPLIHRSRAIAIDMESATLAANAFRFSIPYGALLCVSDRPLHGDLKMPQSAQNFYKDRVREHMLMGITAMEILSTYCPLALHSRKLRGFQAAPFR
ncbi:MAG: AMP nucleosidase [Alphaproteobacteria bacterium]|nr:AMP nucleosidase [Alphaproteobacteria bacterium]